jgi:hypothetical protein
MAAGAVLDLPVHLVDERRWRHSVFVAARARHGIAERLVVAARTIAGDFGVSRVVELDRRVEVGERLQRGVVRHLLVLERRM